VNADEDLSRGGFWRRDFFKLQDFGTAEFVHNDGFHFMTSDVACIWYGSLMLATHQEKKNCRRMSAEPDGFNQGMFSTMGHQTPAA
jgi:hypothetical protein